MQFPQRATSFAELAEVWSDRVPATPETFAQLSRTDRDFYRERIVGGLHGPTELAARCLRNEGLRSAQAEDGCKRARLNPLARPARSGTRRGGRPPKEYSVEVMAAIGGKFKSARALFAPVQASAAEVTA
jgi:hypothetical protein